MCLGVGESGEEGISDEEGRLRGQEFSGPGLEWDPLVLFPLFPERGWGPSGAMALGFGQSWVGGPTYSNSELCPGTSTEMRRKDKVQVGWIQLIFTEIRSSACTREWLLHHKYVSWNRSLPPSV